MIPQAYITEWQNMAPWQSDAQIEQDLIVNRIMVDIYNNDFLREHLLFRGGTALYKLFFEKPFRYSEDLDFVQRTAGPIKPIVETIQNVINPWLGKSKTEQRRDGFRIFYYFVPESDLEITKKIKIEINTREHFSVFPPEPKYFKVSSRWYSGDCTIQTYNIDELASTKLRALYQRKKGRDLFDLHKLMELNLIDPVNVVASFKKYLGHSGLMVSKKEFQQNLIKKLDDYIFLHDTDILLLPSEEYDPVTAAEKVKQLIDLL